MVFALAMVVVVVAMSLLFVGTLRRLSCPPKEKKPAPQKPVPNPRKPQAKKKNLAPKRIRAKTFLAKADELKGLTGQTCRDIAIALNLRHNYIASLRYAVKNGADWSVSRKDYDALKKMVEAVRAGEKTPTPEPVRIGNVDNLLHDANVHKVNISKEDVFLCVECLEERYRSIQSQIRQWCHQDRHADG